MKITLPTEVGSLLNSNLGPIKRRLVGDLQAPAFIHSKTLPSTSKIPIIISISCHIITDCLETKKDKENERRRKRERVNFCS